MNLIGQIFCGMPSLGRCVPFCSWLLRGCGLLRGRPQRSSIIFLPLHQRYILLVWFIPVDVDLGHQAVVLFARFLCIVLFSPFPWWTLGKQVSLWSSHLQGKELRSPYLLRTEYGILLHRRFVSFPFIYLFSHMCFCALLYIHTRTYTYISLDSWIFIL